MYALVRDGVLRESSKRTKLIIHFTNAGVLSIGLVFLTYDFSFIALGLWEGFIDPGFGIAVGTPSKIHPG